MRDVGPQALYGLTNNRGISMCKFCGREEETAMEDNEKLRERITNGERVNSTLKQELKSLASFMGKAEKSNHNLAASLCAMEDERNTLAKEVEKLREEEEFIEFSPCSNYAMSDRGVYKLIGGRMIPVVVK